ncbi:uncharacterized protein [Ambystoma mexicanum]|uniref:uncharacterized protein isoform X2 n=1 Tax=Ambystoma mexicanum TaxID=8296 RepID=UPI0037E86C40
MFCRESDEVAFHDDSPHFSEDEWKPLQNWENKLYRSVMREIQQAFNSLGPLIATTVLSLSSKGKEELIQVEKQTSDRRHTIKHLPEIPPPNTDIRLRNKEESVSILINHLGEEIRESSANPNSGNAVISFDIKDEEETYCLDHRDSNIQRSISSCTGKRTMKRKKILDNSLKQTDKSTLCKSAGKKLKANMGHSDYERRTSNSELWSGHHLEQDGGETAQLERGYSKLTPSNLHQIAPYVQSLEPDKTLEGSTINDNIIPCESTPVQSYQTYLHIEGTEQKTAP